MNTKYVVVVKKIWRVVVRPVRPIAGEWVGL